MTRLLVFSALLSLSLPASAQLPRLGDVFTCHVAKGCTEEIVGDQHFYAMSTPRYLIRVAISPESKYHKAQMTIENLTSKAVKFSPADFRIEVGGPKLKRLSFVEPDHLKLRKPKAVKPSRLAKASDFVLAERQKVATAADELRLLVADSLAPAAKATGLVYFERHGTGKEMSLVVPISGTIFEFPYTPVSR